MCGVSAVVYKFYFLYPGCRGHSDFHIGVSALSCQSAVRGVRCTVFLVCGVLVLVRGAPRKRICSSLPIHGRMAVTCNNTQKKQKCMCLDLTPTLRAVHHTPPACSSVKRSTSASISALLAHVTSLYTEQNFCKAPKNFRAPRRLLGWRGGTPLRLLVHARLTPRFCSSPSGVPPRYPSNLRGIFSKTNKISPHFQGDRTPQCWPCRGRVCRAAARGLRCWFA